MSEAFPAELKQFVAQHVESLAQLEALLILRQSPEQHWHSPDLAQRLYITPDMCEAILADLEGRGFVARSPEGKAYHYHPRDRAVDQLIGDLATIYQQRRVAVITEIYSKPVTKVQTFADAFRLRREEP